MKNSHLILNSIVIFTIFVIVTLCVVLQTQIVAQLDRWDVLPKTDHLTELYFTDINKLPQTYTPGKTQAITFTIHNMEHRAMDYTYELLEQDTSGAIQSTLASGSLHLASDQYKNILLSITPIDIAYHTHIKMLIKLVHTPLSIEYLATKA